MAQDPQRPGGTSRALVLVADDGEDSRTFLALMLKPRYDEAAAKLAWERTVGWFNKYLK